MRGKLLDKSRKGQVAIWVILGIAIFVLIVLFFYLINRGKGPSLDVTDDLGPQDYIQRCLRDNAREAVSILTPQGGFIEPSNFKIYNDTKIEYLCKNTGNYRPCINQHPMFLNEMKEELYNYLYPRIEDCFVSLEEELVNRNAQVEMNDLGLEIGLAPDRIFLTANRNMKVTQNNQLKEYESFETELVSPLYDLGLIAMEIANQEAKYCYFEYVGYMILYPRYDVQKFAMSDSTKIYTIKDKKTKLAMNIATRSCAIPPGI